MMFPNRVPRTEVVVAGIKFKCGLTSGLWSATIGGRLVRLQKRTNGGWAIGIPNNGPIATGASAKTAVEAAKIKLEGVAA